MILPGSLDSRLCRSVETIYLLRSPFPGLPTCVRSRLPVPPTPSGLGCLYLLTPCIPVLLLTVLARGQVADFPGSLLGTVSVLGFTLKMQARQCIRPNRVQHGFVYRLVFRFRLLPTPPLDDAVAFRYGQASAAVRWGLPPLCWCVLSGADLAALRTFQQTTPCST